MNILKNLLFILRINIRFLIWGVIISKNKILYILLLFTLLIVCVGVVSAADNNTTNLQSNLSTVSNSTNSNLLSDDSLNDNSNTYYVGGNITTDGNGSSDNPYNNLKLALNNANNGDTIIINGGTFSGVNNVNLVISKSLTLKAARGANPIFNAQSNSRIFVINAPNVVLDGLTLINGKLTNNYGGALFVQKSDLTITNCTFRNNKALAGGSVFISRNVNNTVFNNTWFDLCDATYGGGVYIYDTTANNTLFKNVLFRFCSASKGLAGGIYNVGNNTRIVDSEFYRTQANHGGSIFNEGLNLFIDNSTFIKNVAYGQGGSIYSKGIPLTIVNSNFTGENAYSSDLSGGALILNGIGNKIINSTFSNILALGKGGGILFTRSNNLVINCTFNNDSCARGGAIAYRPYENETSENNTIINCVFTNNGKDVIDLSNSSYTKGGAIYAMANNTKIINSSFDNNSAIMGGAILFTVNSTNNSIESSNFTNNVAVYYNGGAIVSGGTNDYISNSKFINNTAQNYGGAISMDNITVVNSSFVNNKAKIGSTVYSINSTITKSNFSDNSVIIALNKVSITDSNSSAIKIVSYNNDRIVNGNYTENLTVFDNGYLGYCAEKYSDSIINGVIFDDYTIFNSLNGNNVSDLFKILIFEYYNGTSLQTEINILTDEDYLNSNNTIIKDVVAKYNAGLRINGKNIVKVLDNGTVNIYNFKFLITPQGTQNAFMFKVLEGANETVIKKTITPVVFNGNDTKFNITVTNNGNCNLTGIFVCDNDFNGLNYKSFESNYNWTYNSINNTWILNDTLEPNQSADLTIIFSTNKSGVFVNNVSSGIGNYTFSNSSNITTVFTPNMTVVKIVNNPVVFVGNLTSFTVVVTNTGDCNLTGVSVLESNYTGLSYFNFTGVNWTKNGDVFTYANTLGVGESVNFTVVFKTVKSGNFTNIVIASSNETGNVSANNTTTVKTENHNNNTIDNKTKHNNTTNQDIVKYNNKNNLSGLGQGTPATGIPIFVLFIALISLLLLPKRRE